MNEVVPDKFEGIVAFDTPGRKIGALEYVYYDEINGQPKWAVIGIGDGDEKRLALSSFPSPSAGEAYRLLSLGTSCSVPRSR